MRRPSVTKWLFALSGAIVMVLVLSCGGDDKSSGSESSKAASCGAAGSSDFVGNRLVVGVEYSGEETKDFRIAGGGAQAWLHRPHLETLLTKDCETGEPAPLL